jgi:hypothetical protein
VSNFEQPELSSIPHNYKRDNPEGRNVSDGGEQQDIKQELAAEAVKLVTSSRQKAYGPPEQNFERICRLWNAHMINRGLLQPDTSGLDPSDVAVFMVLMKLARLAETPDHRDSVVDVLGYALCYGEIELSPSPSEGAKDMPNNKLRRIDNTAATGEGLIGMLFTVYPQPMPPQAGAQQ